MAKKSPEDAFFDNLLLGLNATLSNVPRICNVTMEKRSPCDKSNIMTWEQRHCVYLTEDMKKFYLSTDGFLLQWSYQYAPNDIRRVGHIHFPHLGQITLLRENVEPIFQANNDFPSNTLSNTTLASNPLTSASSTSVSSQLSARHLSNSSSNSCNISVASKDQWGNSLPLIGPKTKIFELNTINEVAKVCLIYDSSTSNNPKIYLLELDSFKWVFLADNFSEYLRMAIAHLGLPYWELCFASCGLPSWTEQLFLLLAPHLLEENEYRQARLINPAPEHPYNILDPNIFRIKIKSNMSKANSNAKHKYEGKNKN